MVKVAVDAMGGDFGPKPIKEGVVQALKERDFEAVLVGDETEIKNIFLKNFIIKLVL